jgi:hypothetical protein
LQPRFYPPGPATKPDLPSFAGTVSVVALGPEWRWTVPWRVREGCRT